MIDESRPIHEETIRLQSRFRRYFANDYRTEETDAPEEIEDSGGPIDVLFGIIILIVLVLIIFFYCR